MTTAPAPTRPPERVGQRRARGRSSGRRGWAPYGFLAPAIVLFVLLLALPIGYALYLSLRTVRITGLGLGSGGRSELWAGLSNYGAVLGDPAFVSSLGRAGLYGLVVVPTMLGLALLYALLLDSRRARARTFSRMSIFLPYAVPVVISSLLWGFLYLPRVSPFFDVAEALGWVIAWQPLSPDLVLFSIANIAVWGGLGYNMIVIYTALKAVPSELYEAARIDGASELTIALRIKIPLLVPAIILTTVFSMIATLQVFAEPMTLRPLTNTISTTWSPLMTVYRDAFVRNDVHTASAASVLIAVATFVLSFGFLRLVQRRAFGQEG